MSACPEFDLQTCPWVDYPYPYPWSGCATNLGGDGDRKGVLISSSRPIELLKLVPQNVVIRFIFTKLPSGRHRSASLVLFCLVVVRSLLVLVLVSQRVLPVGPIFERLSHLLPRPLLLQTLPRLLPWEARPLLLLLQRVPDRLCGASPHSRPHRILGEVLPGLRMQRARRAGTDFSYLKKKWRILQSIDHLLPRLVLEDFCVPLESRLPIPLPLEDCRVGAAFSLGFDCIEFQRGPPQPSCDSIGSLSLKGNQ